jgi:hypothetical protein
MSLVTTDVLTPLAGSVIVRTRDHPPIASIAGERVGSGERGKAWAAPMVLIDEHATTFDVGAGQVANARLWLQEALFVFRCYGSTNPQADQLAFAVIALWHECGRDGPVLGTNGAYIRNAWLSVKNGPVDEPRAKRPLATVRMRVFGGTLPIEP